jgi:hypothetical protein
MAGAINIDEFRKDILSSDEIAIAAKTEAEKILEINKEILIKDFNTHAVTMEIEAGEEANNISGTLGHKGNLFSFIGFEEGTNPVSVVRGLLNEIKLGNMKKVANSNVVEFKVEIPSKEEFESVTKMPWETGRSWLYEIERAISGLSSYLYGQFKNSRSGTGIQADHEVNSSRTFTPVKYFGAMMEKFIDSLKK